MTRAHRDAAAPRDNLGTPMPTPEHRTRLQKLISDAGVASRRAAEELILQGRVLVNDEVVQALPAFVDPIRDRVVVDGRRVRPARREYFMLHKPKGFICASRDARGRRCVTELLPEGLPPLFPAGRLDADATGLLLLTNDGEWALRVTHPRFAVPKLYRAEVRGRVAPESLERLRKGVFVDGRRTRADHCEILHLAPDRTILQFRMSDSPGRGIRLAFVQLGHPLKTLTRTQIGSLHLKGLPLGACRRLTASEIETFRRSPQPSHHDDAPRHASTAPPVPARRGKPDDAPRPAPRPRNRPPRRWRSSPPAR